MFMAAGDVVDRVVVQGSRGERGHSVQYRYSRSGIVPGTVRESWRVALGFPPVLNFPISSRDGLLDDDGVGRRHTRRHRPGPLAHSTSSA